jgi:hypothetical protein
LGPSAISGRHTLALIACFAVMILGYAFFMHTKSAFVDVL